MYAAVWRRLKVRQNYISQEENIMVSRKPFGCLIEGQKRETMIMYVLRDREPRSSCRKLALPMHTTHL